MASSFDSHGAHQPSLTRANGIVSFGWQANLGSRVQTGS